VFQFRVFDHALLKTEKIRAGRIGFVWGRLAEQAAQVVEMTLIGGSFLALIARPFLFELGGSHLIANGNRTACVYTF
jgi:hypothetical protein